ncbi:c-type cytochrome biogenesis protein CcmI [Rhodopila sp.]|uniref:c-type cytochrome biogenesis protein CcmI n=1 Tax=Rhodopila sp. TaxID=2480087 RepID=UPI003D0CD565
MILPFLLALLAFGTLLPILAPLLRGSRPVPPRASFDQAVYRDQLHELDRDITRGMLSPAEAAAARLEIQRRLLAADRVPAAPPRLSRSPVLAAIVLLVIAAGSVSSYLWLGSPGVPDEPYSSRTAELAADNSQPSLRAAVAALATKLKQNPGNAQGWVLYGRSLAMLNQWDQAEDAYHHAIDLGQTSPDVLADHAEVMVMQAGGTVTPAAETALRQVLKADPASGMARYYLAIAAMQAGEPRRAIDGLQALLAELPADSPVRPQLGRQVAGAAQAAGIPVPKLAEGRPPAPGPTAAAELAGSGGAGSGVAGSGAAGSGAAGSGAAGSVGGPDAKAVADAANMSDAQRQTMIRGMVAQLAAKQQADPSNPDGWLRLGRAYSVLHEPDRAADAFDKAAGLKPDDVSIPLQEARALLSDHAPTDKVSPRVVGLLKRVEAANPDQPLVLWYLGMAAVQDAHPDQARKYWNTLLTQVPPGSEDAKVIQSALDTLSRQKPGAGG